MDLLKITIGELEHFCASERFRRLEIKPLSPLRAKSYLANPRAEATDVVLYLLVDGDRLIAFRSILPDRLFADGQSLRVGWCSGVWTHPDYRGNRLWKRLLTEALSDWDDRLLLTNYAPTIPALYGQYRQFNEWKRRSGYRFYLYPDLRERMRAKRPGRLLKILCLLPNGVARIASDVKRLLAGRLRDAVDCAESAFPDGECIECLQEALPETLFRRGTKELNWIFNHPWTTEERGKEFRYPFSYDGVARCIRAVNCFLGEILIGSFIYSVVNRKMKILYYYERREYKGLMGAPVVRLAQRFRVKHVTILDAELSRHVKALSKYFLFYKSFESNIYAFFSCPNDDGRVFDGDGDFCFT